MRPTLTAVEVVPVAGHDSMLLNLSGAHGPFFTRNVVIFTDSTGRTGLGETPGGSAIRRTIEQAGCRTARRARRPVPVAAATGDRAVRPP